jgi:hypothetical protein
MDVKEEAPRIVAAMSKVYGEPYEPDDPRNQEPDFQLGYVRGLQGEQGEWCQGITDEWIRRGKPETADASFKNWKRGYWAGRLTAIARRETTNGTET